MLIARRSLAIWEAPKDAPKDATMLAEGRYDLVNNGSDVVRIVDVRSDCGCAEPQVNPRVIRPGQTAIVTVGALVVPYLSRDLNILLETDSKVTPKVFLRFRVIGNLKPPRLADASGDLSFVAVSPEDKEYSHLTVTTVERPGCLESPRLSTDLPFLRFEEAGADEGPPDEGYILKRRKYRVFLTTDTPSGTSVGNVTVSDPWNPAEHKDVSVLVRPKTSMTCTPSRLSLGSDRGEATLLVTTDETNDQLAIALKFPAEIHADFIQEIVGKSGAVHRITVSFKASHPSAGAVGRIEIRGSISAETLIVPVVFTSEIPGDPQSSAASKEGSGR